MRNPAADNQVKSFTQRLSCVTKHIEKGILHRRDRGALFKVFWPRCGRSRYENFNNTAIYSSKR